MKEVPHYNVFRAIAGERDILRQYRSNIRDMLIRGELVYSPAKDKDDLYLRISDSCYQIALLLYVDYINRTNCVSKEFDLPIPPPYPNSTDECTAIISTTRVLMEGNHIDSHDVKREINRHLNNIKI